MVNLFLTGLQVKLHLMKLPRTLKTRHYNDIMKCLLQYFPELLGNLEVSEMAFNRKFFEPEFMANKKWLDSFESKK